VCDKNAALRRSAAASKTGAEGSEDRTAEKPERQQKELGR